MNNPTIDSAHFDVRSIPCREKHAQIFRRWTELPVGGFFVLINDHDPVPLYYQFAAIFPHAFTWDYLVAGPDEFHVKITRTAPTTTPAAMPRPAGGCGHHRASSSPDTLDVRGLEPPEPMLRILLALESVPANGKLRAITDRKPVHLLAELTNRGIHHESTEQADGSWLNTFSIP